MNSYPQQHPNELINDNSRNQSLRNSEVGDVCEYSVSLLQDEVITHISHLTRDTSAALNRFFFCLGFMMYSESANILVAHYDKLTLPNSEALQHVGDLQAHQNRNAHASIVLQNALF